jgi:hypothetical protein
MATYETDRLRRAVVFVVMETDLVMPGSSEPLLKDYARMLAADMSESEILLNILEVPVLLAEAQALQQTTEQILAAIMKRY